VLQLIFFSLNRWLPRHQWCFTHSSFALQTLSLWVQISRALDRN